MPADYAVQNMLMNNISKLVDYELGRAIARHSPMASTHEAYAVVLEEMDEWWDMIKANNTNEFHRLNGAKELIQIAAMAHRALLDCYAPEVLALAKGIGV